MRIKCPYCDHRVEVPDEYRDETILCPHCRRHLIAHPDDPHVAPDAPPQKSISRPAYGIFTGLIGLGLFALGLLDLSGAETALHEIMAIMVFALGTVILAMARLMDVLSNIVYELRRLNAHHKSPS